MLITAMITKHKSFWCIFADRKGKHNNSLLLTTSACALVEHGYNRKDFGKQIVQTHTAVCKINLVKSHVNLIIGV